MSELPKPKTGCVICDSGSTAAHGCIPPQSLPGAPFITATPDPWREKAKTLVLYIQLLTNAGEAIEEAERSFSEPPEPSAAALDLTAQAEAILIELGDEFLQEVAFDEEE